MPKPILNLKLDIYRLSNLLRVIIGTRLFERVRYPPLPAQPALKTMT
jgi:hypothetical protein